MQTPGSPRRATAEERKAILDQRVAAAVADGARLEWWGGGPFEAVVSNRRYLAGRHWGFILPALVLMPFLVGPSTRNALGGLRPIFDLFVIVVFAGAIVVWAGRTRYQRISVDDDGGVTVAGTSLLRLAAALTLLAGLAGTIPGGAHLQGVIAAATSRGYPYDFRLASMLTLGIGMVFAGVLCLTAVRGLAHGQRRAMDRAVIGSLLLVLVTFPITPHPVQGQQAAAVMFPALVDFIVLGAVIVGDWHRALVRAKGWAVRDDG